MIDYNDGHLTQILVMLTGPDNYVDTLTNKYRTFIDDEILLRKLDAEYDKYKQAAIAELNSKLLTYIFQHDSNIIDITKAIQVANRIEGEREDEEA